MRQGYNDTIAAICLQLQFLDLHSMGRGNGYIWFDLNDLGDEVMV